MAMEPLQLHDQEQQQPLASSDSFSYRWLILNNKPAAAYDDKYSHCRSSSSLHDDFSYIDMDPNNCLQRRAASDSPSSSPADSNFNFPPTHSLNFQLHADQLFSSALLMPLQPLSPAAPQFQTPPLPLLPSAHLPSMPTSKFSNVPPSQDFVATTKNLLSLSNVNPLSEFIHKCRRYWCSKRIFHKYLGFLRPLYRKFCGTKRPLPRMVNCVESLQTTPRTSITINSGADWCHTNLLFESHIDNLIHEAVLHCKKSTGETAV